MSPIRIIILVVAAMAAMGAALLVRSLSSEPGQPAILPTEIIQPREPEEPKVKVLVVNRDLSRGEILTPDVLQWATWPEKTASPIYIREEDRPDAVETLSGQRVRADFVAFEPVLEAKIVDTSGRGYMAARLGEGMRAISIQITADSASGGFILPDDRVDVLLTHTPEFLIDGLTSTITVVRNARVLAIDQGFLPGDSTSRIGSTATLELGQEAAEVLTLSESLGTLSLTLRSLADAQIDGEAVIARTELLARYGDPYSGPGSRQVRVFRSGQSAADVGVQ